MIYLCSRIQFGHNKQWSSSACYGTWEPQMLFRERSHLLNDSMKMKYLEEVNLWRQKLNQRLPRTGG